MAGVIPSGLRARVAAAARGDLAAEAATTGDHDDASDPRAINDRANEAYWRYRESHDPQDLDAAIADYEQALTVAPARSPELSTILTSYAYALERRHDERALTDDLDWIVEVREASLAMAEPGSPERSACLTDLARALLAHARRSTDPAAFERVIEVAKDAAANSPPGSEELAGARASLAHALLERHRCKADEKDVNDAIAVCEQTVAESPPGSYGRRNCLWYLGEALNRRFKARRQPEDLDRAVASFDAAVGEVWESPPELLQDLGRSYRMRFDERHDSEDLEHAIWAFNEAVSTFAPGHPARPSALNALGGAFVDRFTRTGEVDAVQAAVEAFAEAVATAPPGSPDRAWALKNQASAALELQGLVGDAQRLEDAVAALEECLGSSPPDLAVTMSVRRILANSLSARYHARHDPTDLERAIALAEQALKESSGESQAAACEELARNLATRYEDYGEPDDLTRSIELFDRAVAETSPGSLDLGLHLGNLAAALALRYDLWRRPGDERRAVTCFREACQRLSVVAPDIVLTTSMAWARWAERRQCWPDAVEASEIGLQAGAGIVGRQLGWNRRLLWLNHTSALSAHAAYAHARAGNTDAAAVALERGRATLLSVVVERNHVDLRRLRSREGRELVERYSRANARINEMERRELRWNELRPTLAEMRAAREQFDAAVAEIQRVPGFAQVLRPAEISELRTAATDAPLVYLTVSFGGGLAVIVDEKTSPAATVALDDLNETTVRERAMLYRQAYEGRHDDPGTWKSTLDDTTNWLWDVAIGPLLAELPQTSKIVLLPSGLLGILPLHAAWTHDTSSRSGRHYALDEIAFTFAPNARALLRARNAVAAGTSPDSMLAVENPAPVAAPALAYAEQEVKAVTATFGRSLCLRHEEATVAAVLAAISDHNVVHFACHAASDLMDPLGARLFLSGNTELSLRDVLGEDLSGLRLATLAACETFRSSAAVPEEALGLATVLMELGAAGVVGSLWSVPDASTTMLCVRFYDLWRRDGLAPPEALRQAQLWLRDASNAEKIEAFPDIMGSLTPPASSAARAFWDGARSHSHLHHWAGFTYVGI